MAGSASSTTTVSRSKASSAPATPDGLLFAANLNAGRLGEIIGSAKAIGDVVMLRLDAGKQSSEESHFTFWAMDEIPSPGEDPHPIVAMVGQADDSLFNAI